VAYLSFLKQVFYRRADQGGVNARLLDSPWRTRRLLVLCYHGISLDDEHEWAPLYMPTALFRQRLERIRKMGCIVLPLGPAVEMLYAGTLPPRAVVITFDDGFYDFYAKAWPHLRQFGFPATTYLTTYYSVHNVPVFDPMCSYLLWKGSGRILNWPELDIGQVILNPASERRLCRQIREMCLRKRLGGSAKNELLRALAERLCVDFDDLCARRVLHLMTLDEVREIAAEGCDFQLHTHRHRVYRSRERMFQELIDNRDAIERVVPRRPTHFCYPGGHTLPEFPPWFREFGIESATTCRQALASSRCDRLLLPRLLDGPGISMEEFSAWLSGLAQFVPRKVYPFAEGQLSEEPPP
jgi:peptidoglycan/xylan/chitin deacetylase (PgdA/CDA1 family)